MVNARTARSSLPRIPGTRSCKSARKSTTRGHSYTSSNSSSSMVQTRTQFRLTKSRMASISSMLSEIMLSRWWNFSLPLCLSSGSHPLHVISFVLTQRIPHDRSKTSEQLLSTDTHSGTSSYKFTYSVEIIPICRDDLICIPPKQARAFSNISYVHYHELEPVTLC